MALKYTKKSPHFHSEPQGFETMEESLIVGGWGKFGPKRRFFFTSIMAAYWLLGIWQIASLVSFTCAHKQTSLVWLAIAALPGLVSLFWRRADLGLRATLGMAFFYCMAVTGFLLSQWSAPLWLLSASLLAAMFIGLIAAATTLAINLLLLIAAAYYSLEGVVVLPAGSSLDVVQWAWIITGFMIFCSAGTLGIAYLLRGLRTSMASLTSVSEVLKQEQEQLRLESMAHGETVGELKKSEARFRLLAQNAVDIIWMADLELNLTYVSPSIERILHMTPAEALSRGLKMYIPPEEYDKLSAYLAAEKANQAMGAPPFGNGAFDVRIYRDDGEMVWLSTGMGIMRDENGNPMGIQGVSRDVTRRKKADQEIMAKSDELGRALEELSTTRKIIQTSRNKLKAIFDGLSDPIISVTPEREIESMNLAAAAFAQGHPRDLVGLSAAEYLNRIDLHPTVGETVLESFKTMLESRSYQWRLVEYPSNEGPMFFEINVTPAHNDGGGIALGIIHFVDVTEIKRLEIQIRRYNEELEAMVAERTAELTVAHQELSEERDRLAQVNMELQRLDQLRHDLTNMVVHDMKGPLAELMGNLDLLYYDLEKMQRDETLDLATMGARDLLRMIMNLLDIDRLEEDRLKARKQAIDFVPLAQRVVDKFTTMIRLKGLDITIDDSTASGLFADQDLMERVIQNLLTNALQYTDKGGIAISAHSSDDATIIVSVADTGKGIPKKAHDLIFRKFMQASDSGGPRTSTGLGLTFCKLATEAHGGKIWFESTEGKGSTFYVSLPMQTGEQTD